MGPFEAILCVKRAFLAPKNPILGSKKREIFGNFFVPNHSRKVPGGSGTLKSPKLSLHGPKLGLFGPILWAKWAILGSKNAIFSEIFFHSESLLDGPWRVWDPQKSKIKPPWPPIGPLWGHFVGKMGHFGVKNAIFFIKNFIPNRSCMVPGGSSSLKPPKLRLHCP